jgi:peptide/nickel transport system substrate-binding protein
MVQKILMRLRLGRQRHADQQGLSAVHDDIEQRKFDPDKAAFHYKKSGQRPGAAAHLRRRLPRCCRRRPALPAERRQGRHHARGQARAGRRLLVGSVEQAALLGMSYWTGRPDAGPGLFHRLLSKAEWNDTRFFREDFDKMLICRAFGTRPAKRKIYVPPGAMILRDEGGVIVPMFNNYIDATSATGRRLGR